MADMGAHSIVMSNWAMKWSMKSSYSFVITPTGRQRLACNSQHPREPKQPKIEETPSTNITNTEPNATETNSAKSD